MSTAGRVGSIARRFSAAAGTYDRHAQIQQAVARQLMREFEGFPLPARILEIGCGTGLLTELLHTRFPAAEIDALDSSSAMLAQARQRLRAAPNIRWHEGAVHAFQPGARFDLLASSCVLHWIEPLDEILDTLAGWLTPGGRLAAAVMVDGTLAELRAARRHAAPHKPAGEFPTPEQLDRVLAAVGLEKISLRVETLQGVCASAAALLEQLHAQGLTAGPLAGSGRRLNRTELRRLMQHYDRQFAAPGGVRATYRVAYLQGEKE